jgi:hypothetical protein
LNAIPESERAPSVVNLSFDDTFPCDRALEVRSGDSDQPYAVRSRLGWAILGPLKDDTAPSAVNIHFEQSRDILLQE